MTTIFATRVGDDDLTLDTKVSVRLGDLMELARFSSCQVFVETITEFTGECGTAQLGLAYEDDEAPVLVARMGLREGGSR